MDNVVPKLLGSLEELFQVCDHVSLLEGVRDEFVIGAGLFFEKLVLHVCQHQCGVLLVNLHLLIAMGEFEHFQSPVIWLLRAQRLYACSMKTEYERCDKKEANAATP